MNDDAENWRGIARRWERRSKRNRGTLTYIRRQIDMIADRLDVLATRGTPSIRDIEHARDQLDALADSISDVIASTNSTRTPR